MDMAADSLSLGTPEKKGEKKTKHLSPRVSVSDPMKDSNWSCLHHMLHFEPLLLLGELARSGSFSQCTARAVQSQLKERVKAAWEEN